MSIPLVQEATKDAINTSIIAIKRNIERINMLLGLVDNDSPDLSGLATKQELEDAVNSLQPVDEVTVGNMQSVTSNAVAKLFLNYSYDCPSSGVTLSGYGYTEYNIHINYLPKVVEGYTLVGSRVIQADGSGDAFLFNLHKGTANYWRLTVFNCAGVNQNAPAVTINLLFMKNV